MRTIPPIILIGFSILTTCDSNSKIINKNFNGNKNNQVIDLQFIYNPAELTYDPVIHQYIENVYKFMLADIAEWREEILVAKNNFTELLKNTQDPIIAEILTKLAIETDDYLLSTLAVQEWATLEPNNPSAQLIAIILLVDQDPELIKKFLNQAIKNNPQIDTQLYNVLFQLSDKQKTLLAEHIQTLINDDKKDPIKYLCLANIQVQLNNITAAEKSLKIALNLKPSLTNAIILQAKLIKYNTKSDQLALNYLEKQTKKFHTNEQLHIFYANALFDNNKNQEALKILQPIHNSNNKSYELDANILTAEIYMQPPTVNLNKAKIYLTKLLNDNLANGKVYYLLGQIAEKQSNISQAIKFYTLIKEKPYHLVSFLRAALLLAENQQLNLALDTLNQTQAETNLEQKQLILLKVEFSLELQDLANAIEYVEEGLKILEDDIDLLYASSVVHSLNNQIDIAENNLKKIIKLQPENHIALNALGFILAIHTHRHKEALSYLEQALILSPQNPTYMDNIGILLYQMGKIQDSLNILSVAYTLSDSINIATHLGEVLWASGEQQKAKIIWEKAWKTDPNDLELVNVLNQYQVFFAKTK